LNIKAIFSVFIKFGIVGFSSFIIDFSMTYLLKERFKINKFIANTTGFLIAATFNFFMNRLWTFKSQDLDVTSQFLKFMAIASVGLLINNGIIYFFNDKFRVNFYISKILAVIVVMFYNFSMNLLITFTK
jgi:putative flippase GtrA